jgi:site-specific DNA-methyltransferase (adenine-specific)/modification methylase
VKPYWQSSDGAIVVYHARFEDVLAAGVVPVREVALVHDDPPYGIRLDTRARGKERREHGLGSGRSSQHPKKPTWAPVVGDGQPFDPAPILALSRPTVLWGGNHYASRLPDSPSWLFWDKREEQPEIDNACGEMAWTNLGGPVRRFAFLWRGLVRRSEGMGGATGSKPHLHPTQKPIALCSWVYARAKLKRGDLVFVPHMGSGPDLPACRAAGLRCIAVEVERAYCDTAIARLGAVTAERAAEPAGPLFAPR